jgi:hypothetical protein
LTNHKTHQTTLEPSLLYSPTASVPAYTTNYLNTSYSAYNNTIHQSPRSATTVPVPPFVITGGGRKTPTTPPRGAPKRKHEDIAEQTPAVISSALLAEQQPSRKASKTSHTAEAAALPATPLSSNGNMDSDIEDFNSVASSDDFGEDAGSSLGGGKLAQSFAGRGVAG